MKLTLPYPPSSNNLYASIRGRRVLSLAGRQYKSDVAVMAAMLGVEYFRGPVIVTLHFYRPRKSGDLDNVQKCLLDSLTGILWYDDSQIVELHAYRHDDKTNPRAEVEIKQVQQAQS